MESNCIYEWVSLLNIENQDIVILYKWSYCTALIQKDDNTVYPYNKC